MLTALLVRGATLPGADEGIRFYLQPNWTKVYDFQVITSVFRANAVLGRGCGLCFMSSARLSQVTLSVYGAQVQSPPQHLSLRGLDALY